MTRPDLDALAALLDKATPGPWALDDYHFGWISAPSELRIASTIASSRSADDALLIVAAVNALPALLAHVRELGRKCEPRRDLSGSTHWDIADAGAVCHDECAVAQIKGAALAMRERCAQVCDWVGDRYGTPTACAAAIRALEV